MIKKIHIKKFRSIETMNIDCEHMTTFVGSNDVGKSNIVRALNLFFNGETDSGVKFNFFRDYNRFAKSSKNKAKEIIIDVTFELPRSFQRKGFSNYVIWKKRWRENGEFLVEKNMLFADNQPLPASSKIRKHLQRHFLYYAPAIKDRNFFSDLLGQVYDLLSDTGNNVLHGSGNDFNKGLADNMDSLIKGIYKSLGEKSTISLPTNLRPIFENIEIINEIGIPLNVRGDGIKIRHIPEIFKFLSELNEKSNSSEGSIISNHIWIFEEPENNLELNLAFEMVEHFKKYISDSSNCQLFITTHSPIFYDMKINENKKHSKRHYITQSQKFSEIEKINDDDLNNQMGIMPAIAKAVLEIKEKDDLLNKYYDEMQKNSFDFSKPTIFVEGKTDKIVFERCLNVFFEEYAKNVQIKCQENGGFDSAINSLHSWELHQKHVKHPVKAVAIVDNDPPLKNSTNSTAKTVMLTLPKSLKNVKVLKIEPIGTNRDLLDSLYLPPKDLESLYSDEIWKIAKKNKWLIAVTSLHAFEYYISNDLKSNILKEKKSLDDHFSSLSQEWQLRLKYKFSPKGKSDAANYINIMSDDDIMKHLINTCSILDKAIKYIINLPSK